MNNEMESNHQLLYEEFNNITEIDDNYCLLANNNKNDLENEASNINKIIKEINNDNYKEVKCDIDDGKYNIIYIDIILKIKINKNLLLRIKLK